MSFNNEINKDISNATSKYLYNSSTVMKYLRSVLNEINKGYMDLGIRTAFLMKRYIEAFNIDPNDGPKLVLLCMLKDIGLFYQDDFIPKDNIALASASSFLFLKYCSPLQDAAKPLFYYKAKYLEEVENKEYKYGLLMTLLNQVILYNYQEYTVDEIEDLLKKDDRGIFDPKQVKNVIKLLKKDPDVMEKLNSRSSLYIYETQNYILMTKYTDEELLGFINTTNFSFEFHNHETLAHTVTVAVIARALARVSRLPESMCEEIYLAGLVHDIGKIRVPKEILCYPGKLEGDMLKEMQRHVIYTKEILSSCVSYKVVEIASNHHEKLDGSGYPRGLREIDLKIGDKIIAIADIASALYCKRSYKASFPDEKIQQILLSDAKNGKLDLRIVNHLIDNYDEIMDEAKKREKVVLEMYDNMKQKFLALKNSDILSYFFDVKEDDNNLDESSKIEAREFIHTSLDEEVINAFKKNKEDKNDSKNIEENIEESDINNNLDLNDENENMDESNEEENQEEASFVNEESDIINEEMNEENLNDSDNEEKSKDEDGDIEVTSFNLANEFSNSVNEENVESENNFIDESSDTDYETKDIDEEEKEESEEVIKPHFDPRKIIIKTLDDSNAEDDDDEDYDYEEEDDDYDDDEEEDEDDDSNPFRRK